MKIKQISEQYQANWMEGLPLDGVIEMQNSEARFINGIIRELKPKKILEIGVHSGGSSMLILNAIKDNETAHLHSVDYAKLIDYGTTYAVGRENFQGKDNRKHIGWAVNELTPELVKQWTLHTGGHVAEFIDKIGSNIDVCFLDAAHQFPGEALDFLITLPYMSNDGIIIQHDTVLDHNSYMDLASSPLFNLTCISQPVLFATVCSKKIKPAEFNKDIYPSANIGAHQITEDTWKHIDNVFWALNLKWRYLPSDKDMEHIVKVLEKNYEAKNVDNFMQNYELNKKVGVNKNPFATVVSNTPTHPQVDPAMTKRLQRLEKICYAGFAGMLGFLSASALAALLVSLWR